MLLASLSWMSALGLGGTVVVCPDALTASSSCRVTDRFFSPQFLLLLNFVFTVGLRRSLVLGPVSLFGLLAGWIP